MVSVKSNDPVPNLSLGAPGYSTAPDTHPCWPIVWLWFLSIAQYSYRYILQVNDPRSSLLYGPTPAALSAIKYEIFLVFVVYSLVRLSRRSVRIRREYRMLCYITAGSLLTLALILTVRLAVSPGDLEETGVCTLQLMPWATSIFFVPLTFRPIHSFAKTLMVFERLTFWVAFPFWLVTVALAVSGLRYPALSYPGILVRFGGILDDPNGYACLCLFLLVLSVSNRAGAWKMRSSIYVIMLVSTLSLSGYATALAMCLYLLLFRPRSHKSPARFNLLRLSAAIGLALCLIAAVTTLFLAAQTADAITAAKSNSAATHVSNLLPDQAMLDVSSPMTLLFGAGGFSENFYWRILANFGWTGLFATVALVLLWSYYALSRNQRWRRSIGTWNFGLLVGSNGIAYLLVFPLNLIYWSTVSLLVWAEHQRVSVPVQRSQ
jgi:hypothetical protein